MRRRQIRTKREPREIIKSLLPRLSTPKGILFILPVLLGALTVLSSIQGSASSSTLLKIEKEIVRIEAENNDYKAQLVSESSLSRVQESSEALNFIKPSHLVYLNKSEFLAKIP